MVITLTGKPCSGKSTVATILQEKYGFIRISMGEMFKAEAKKRNMSTEEFTAYRTKDPSFDIYVDKQIPNFVKKYKNQNVVIESRVAWHFLSNSFNVFIDIDDDEMAKRLLYSDRTGKEKSSSFEEAKKTTLNRYQLELEVYKKTYDIDCSNFSNYDLVVDSSNLTPEELADSIYEEYKKHFKLS